MGRDKEIKINGINIELMDACMDIKDDIERCYDRILEWKENPEEYNYEFLQDFMRSISAQSIHARKLIDVLRKEIKGK